MTSILVHWLGSGKSALVANWSGQVEEKEKNAFVFVHFIGSSAESASYIKLIRRSVAALTYHLLSQRFCIY